MMLHEAAGAWILEVAQLVLSVDVGGLVHTVYTLVQMKSYRD